MHATVLDEPELEFGGGSRHVDPRVGIAEFGPLDAGTESAPERIHVGIVGPAPAVEGIHDWLTRAREPISGKTAKTIRQAAMHPRFPGFDPDHSFRSLLVMDEKATRAIPPTALRKIASTSPLRAVREAVAIYRDEVAWLAENTRCDVVFCARPEIPESDDDGSDDQDDAPDSPSLDHGEDDNRPIKPDFHDELKAAALGFEAPLQIIRPETWDDPSKPPKGVTRRRVQDPATRAWNLHAALYYKARGTPWRLTRSYSDLTTCYLGVSFYNSADRKLLHTSVAQLFNERGEGLVVRGGAAAVLKSDRRPHLSAQDAADLATAALEQYRQHHGNFPARVVIHKASRFTTDEQEGFEAAIESARVDRLELIWLPGNEPTRLFRSGANPPLRGTFVRLGEDRHLLYTKGSVEQYGTYPGMYIPDPLCFRPVEQYNSPEALAAELLALTKLNWNHTHIDGRMPITLHAATKVRDILRHTDPSVQLAHRYAHYM